MDKKFFTLSLALIVSFGTLISCNSQKTRQNPVPDMHTSQTSIDYDGIYRGTLPCADCGGIKTTIYLNKDHSYKLVEEYLSNTPQKFESTGKFTWSKDGQVITLNSNGGTRKYFVGENTLTMLDKEGNKITSALAPNYILTKNNYGLLNKKWKLVELMGKPFVADKENRKEAFIQFNDADNRYSASAGCNSISGNFETLGFNKLSLQAGMSTMMACPDMTAEDQLKEVLNTADTFQIHGDELLLIKGRMSPLARFKVAIN